MMTEPKAMRELHEIRERLHEEQKGWSAQQIVHYYRHEAEKTEKEFGLHLKHQPHRPPGRKAG